MNVEDGEKDGGKERGRTGKRGDSRGGAVGIIFVFFTQYFNRWHPLTHTCTDTCTHTVHLDSYTEILYLMCVLCLLVRARVRWVYLCKRFFGISWFYFSYFLQIKTCGSRTSRTFLTCAFCFQMNSEENLNFFCCFSSPFIRWVNI